MEKTNEHFLDLQMFADGGSGAAGTSAGTGTESGGTTTQSQDAAVTNKRAKNPLANVVYGKQPEVQQENQQGIQQTDAGTEKNNATEKQPDKSSTFEALIKGEYKEEFDKYFQKTFNERFKQQKQEQENAKQQIESLSSIVDMLSAKYGIDAKDSEALTKAINEDTAYYEKEAEEKGMTVEQLKNMRKMEHENSKLKMQMQERMQQEQIRQSMEEWGRQAEEVKNVYPNFDFRKESENPEFRALITRNIPVKTAYEVIHKDEILGGAMQYTAQQVAQKVTQNIQTRAKRPAENGASSNNGIVTKTDVHSLTKADRAEIARRAARGEKITF